MIKKGLYTPQSFKSSPEAVQDGGGCPGLRNQNTSETLKPQSCLRFILHGLCRFRGCKSDEFSGFHHRFKNLQKAPVPNVRTIAKFIETFYGYPCDFREGMLTVIPCRKVLTTSVSLLSVITLFDTFNPSDRFPKNH